MSLLDAILGATTKKFIIRINVERPIAAGRYDGVLLNYHVSDQYITLEIRLKDSTHVPPTNNLRT